MKFFSVSFDEIPIKQKIAVVLGANVLFILLFYFGFIVPQNEQLVQAMAQVNAEKQKVMAVENFAATKPNLDQYLADLDSKIMQLNNLLPNEPEMSDFLKQAEQHANETGVILTQVHTGQMANKNGYREMPVEISVQGSYLQTVNYLKKLEDGSRFITVRNIQMNAQNGTEPNKQAATLSPSMQLGPQQTVITSKLSTVIFGFGVPPQAKTGPQGQNSQPQNTKK